MKMKAVLSVLLLEALTGAATALFRRYLLVDQEMSWNGAQKYCRVNYVDLATIENQEELQRFQQDVLAFDWYWIGLYRNPDTLNFTEWSDGTRSGFELWDSAEPEIVTNYDSVFGNNYLWYTYNSTSLLPFVCYTWEDQQELNTVEPELNNQQEFNTSEPEVIIVQEMKTWEEALKFCRIHYTDLISLDTESDLLLVNNKTSEILTPCFWTGLRFLDGSWFWVNQASIDEQTSVNLNFMPSCPAPSLRCGARNTESNVLKNRDCEEKMNFMCYR